eukprot:GHVU01092771.1.p2 GENE.GHVU01092771.1~~GHVU01092771.1.p2  ORF type:complete len:162 (+),score=12.64 GHVU01092771.1:1048-1533(+)
MELLKKYGDFSRREIEARRQDVFLAHVSKMKSSQPRPPPPRWRPPSEMGIPMAGHHDFDENMPISVTEVWPRPETSDSSWSGNSDLWIDELASSNDTSDHRKVPPSSSSSSLSTRSDSLLPRPTRKVKTCPKRTTAVNEAERDAVHRVQVKVRGPPSKVRM